MNKVTKTQFTRNLAQAEGITIKQAEEEVNRVFGHLVTETEALEAGGKIDITGVIQVERKHMEARQARNPQTSEIVEVPAKDKVLIRPMTKLKNAVL